MNTGFLDTRRYGRKPGLPKWTQPIRKTRRLSDSWWL